MSEQSKKQMTYADAGVDIDAGDALGCLPGSEVQSRGSGAGSGLIARWCIFTVGGAGDAGGRQVQGVFVG